MIIHYSFLKQTYTWSFISRVDQVYLGWSLDFVMIIHYLFLKQTNTLVRTCGVIYVRHSFRSKADENRIFFLEKDLGSHVRNRFCVTFLYKNHDAFKRKEEKKRNLAHKNIHLCVYVYLISN